MHKTLILVAAGVIGASLPGCEDELDQSCGTTQDCKRISDCCEGCKAINVYETVPSCDSQCAEDACKSKYGADVPNLVAVCVDGTCEIALDPP